MRLLLVLALCAAARFAAVPARADDFSRLLSCVESADQSCLHTIGIALANKIKDPAKRSLMLARFGAADWAAGDRAAGDTELILAWSHLADVPNDGCLPRVKATLSFADLASLFGDASAARVALRRLVVDAKSWPKAGTGECSRPPGVEPWLASVARRQAALGDTVGLLASLDLALRWGKDPAMADVNFALRQDEAAALLAAHDRAGDAQKVCDANKETLQSRLKPDASPADRADTDWQALACYRAAGLKSDAKSAYQTFAHDKLAAMGLGDDAQPKSADAALDAFGPEILSLVDQLSWNDPVLATPAPEAAFPGPAACFAAPTADCLAVHAMAYVDAARHGRVRRADAPDLTSPGALDGFAHFLVGSGGDAVGDQARDWFLQSAQEAPIEHLQDLVHEASQDGDLLWARRIFYSWYNASGKQFFSDLTNPSDEDKADVEEGAWPIHVAWSIANVVNGLDGAFEPEELADFAATAWDDGVSQIPSLKQIPPEELIDADERSGVHLLDLCLRDSFAEWGAKLFTEAHMSERAREARALLPEASRDCAFAKRSVGPILQAAAWFAHHRNMTSAHAMLIEAGERLTRPHYHVYEDADPYVGGASLAVMALGFQRGLIVPPPYKSGL